jgi:hypothetical protein
MTDNDQKAKEIIEATMPDLWMIKELLDKNNILGIDLLRTLYLIENIMNISKWGKVIISIKNGEVVSISGENNFITESELKRNLKVYKNR